MIVTCIYILMYLRTEMVRRERSWPWHQLSIVFIWPKFFKFIYSDQIAKLIILMEFIYWKQDLTGWRNAWIERIVVVVNFSVMLFSLMMSIFIFFWVKMMSILIGRENVLRIKLTSLPSTPLVVTWPVEKIKEICIRQKNESSHRCQHQRHGHEPQKGLHLMLKWWFEITNEFLKKWNKKCVRL